MALSSKTFSFPLELFHLILASFLLHGFLMAHAKDSYFNWVVSHGHLSPFGFEKQVIMINNQFPGPLLNTTTNDNIYVNVHNNLSEPFLLTWNGVQMRRNSWNDGVQGTNCPVPPGQNWTYAFQMKDQIGSFFYFPTIGFQKAAGGYGPIRINNRVVIPIPFDFPHDDFDVLAGDWYNADYKELKASLDAGERLPQPDGILINGSPLANFTFQPGATYRLRISNVGLKTSLNFQIQGHKLLLVETEGTYTMQQYYNSLDVHVGQSMSVLVTADQPVNGTYYMIVASQFTTGAQLQAAGFINYIGSNANPTGSPPRNTDTFNYSTSMQQALSMRMNLTASAARPNPQGSYHYGSITISRTIILENNESLIKNSSRYTVNGISFVHPDIPLKLADYYKILGVFYIGGMPDAPDHRPPAIGTTAIDAILRSFTHIVFQNNQPTLQTWHLDGYSFWVVGMEEGKWNESMMSTYNMIDANHRSTIQVYPYAWTAILVSLDNVGMWNIRSQDEEKRYLGQEIYIRVREVDLLVPPDPRDEGPIPPNTLKCWNDAFGVMPS